MLSLILISIVFALFLASLIFSPEYWRSDEYLTIHLALDAQVLPPGTTLDFHTEPEMEHCSHHCRKFQSHFRAPGHKNSSGVLIDGVTDNNLYLLVLNVSSAERDGLNDDSCSRCRFQIYAADEGAQRHCHGAKIMVPAPTFNFVCESVFYSAQSIQRCREKLGDLLASVMTCAIRCNYTTSTRQGTGMSTKYVVDIQVSDSQLPVFVQDVVAKWLEYDITYVLFWGNVSQQNYTDRLLTVDLYRPLLLNKPNINNKWTEEFWIKPDEPRYSKQFTYETEQHGLYGFTVCRTLPSKSIRYPELLGLEGITNYFVRDRIPIEHVISLGEERSTVLYYALAAVGSTFAVVVFATSVIVFRKCGRNKARRTGPSNEHELQTLKSTPRLVERTRADIEIYEDLVLGRGAFGVVYKGKLLTAGAHKDTSSNIASIRKEVEDCFVAIKQLPDFSTDSDKRRFLLEINLTKQLAEQLGFFEHIVNPLACITRETPYYLVMEYCSSGNLRSFLQTRREYMISNAGRTPSTDLDLNMMIGGNQLLQFAVNVVHAMEYITRKGYVHRDLAARNVLVHKGRYAKVGDFGMTRKVDAKDEQYMDLKGGKVPIKWLAIESLKKGEYSTKTDVWAFGVLLFEMISMGGCPYPTVALPYMLEYLESGKRMQKPRDCDEDIYQTMLSCWNASADDRPTFAELRDFLVQKFDKATEEYNYVAPVDPDADYYLPNTLNK